jgi:hypothetical protein
MAIEPQDHFYHAVGRLTIAWAYLETGLDMAMAVIHHQLGGSGAIEPMMPYALQRKIRYLRKAFTKIPELAQWKDEFLAIADEITAASDKRHDLIHGYVQQHPSQSDATAKMVRFLRDEDMLVAKPFDANDESVSAEVIRVTALSDRYLNIVLALTATVLK